MKNISSQKAKKNIIYGTITRVITIAIGIIMPKLVIVNLGSESNGLLTSVGNILTYLSLLEAGVGTASIQALYKPFAENDRKSVNGIMAATDYFYKRTGIAYLVGVCLLAIGYTVFVETQIPKIEVFLVVFITGLSGVIGYFVQGKIRIFLTAEGKNYVVANITTFTNIGANIAKAIAIKMGANVVLIQATYFAFAVLQMLLYCFYFRREYKWVDLKVKPDFEAISQKNAVLVHQISWLIFSNTDTLLLTFFVSLKAVSVYNMYMLVFGIVESVVDMMANSFLYSLGQSFHNREVFLKKYNAYETIYFAVTFSLFCLTIILAIPFMKLYTEGVSDANYIDLVVAWEFLFYFLLNNARVPARNVINIAQKFNETKYRSLLESIINIIASLILTKRFGIYGVLIGTIVALLYRTNDMIIYSSRIIKRSPWVTYRKIIRNSLIFSAIMVIIRHMTINPLDYPSFALCGFLLAVCVIPVFFAGNLVFERETMRYAFSVLKRMILPPKA